MVTIHRVRVAGTGFPGQPAVMTFHCLDAPALSAHLRAWLFALRGYMPPAVTWTIENIGDILESTTGDLSGSWTDTAELPVTGTGTGSYAAPVGIVANWLTDLFIEGRRLRGRTYVVPLAGAAFDTDGDIAGAALTAIQTASATFVTSAAANLGVHQRPREARAADGSRPAVTARAGAFAVVTAAQVKNKAAVLRSRRD